MSHKPDGDGLAKRNQTAEWLDLDEACAHTGRSLAALKNWVNQGKVKKRYVPKPGARPRVELWREDLDRLIAPVHVPDVVAKRDQTTALVPVEDAIPAVLARLAEALTRPDIELRDKLCWNLREAREMTGLSRPALRELAEAHPECVIRRGRRTWLVAGKLRKVLDD